MKLQQKNKVLEDFLTSSVIVDSLVVDFDGPLAELLSSGGFEELRLIGVLDELLLLVPGVLMGDLTLLHVLSSGDVGAEELDRFDDIFIGLLLGFRHFFFEFIFNVHRYVRM